MDVITPHTEHSASELMPSWFATLDPVEQQMMRTGTTPGRLDHQGVLTGAGNPVPRDYWYKRLRYLSVEEWLEAFTNPACVGLYVCPPVPAGTAISAMPDALQTQLRMAQWWQERFLSHNGEHHLDGHVFVRQYGGKGVAIHYDEQRRPVVQTVANLRTSYPDLMVPYSTAKGEVKEMLLVDAWVKGKHTPRFDEADFRPGKTNMPLGVFNLWRSWKYTGTPTDAEENWPKECDLFCMHLYDVVCRKNEEYFDYLLLWIADLLNNPWRNNEVALVMYGPHGSGKDFVADCLAELLDPYTVVLDKSKQLTGTFNAHLFHTCLVVAQEAFFAGNQSDANTLKSNITSSRLLYEPKGFQAFMGRKCWRLIMTSNHLHVLNVEEGDRRYFVLEVDGGPERNKNLEYHGAMRAEWAIGGREAFLGWMQGDYWQGRLLEAGHDVNKRPDTIYLEQQREHSLQDPWYDELADLLPADDYKVQTKHLLEVLGRPIERQSTADGRRVGAAMRRLGCEQRKGIKLRDKGGKGGNAWVKGKGTVELVAKQAPDKEGLLKWFLLNNAY